MTREQKLQLLQELEEAEKEANTRHFILFKEVKGHPNLLICKSEEYQHLFPETFSKEQRDAIVHQHFEYEMRHLRCITITIRTNHRHS